jgi:hypothetical protein
MPAVVIPCPHCQAELKLKDRSLLGKKGKCPKCAQTFVLEEPDEVELELVAPAPEAVANTQEVSFPTEAAALQPQTFEPPVTGPIGETGGVERMKELRRKNKKRRNFQIIVGGIMAVLLAGTFFYLKAQQERLAKQQEAPKNRTDEGFQQKLKQNLTDLEALAAESPTHGEPIQLTFMPAGTRVVINLHPDEFWKRDTLAEEFRFCLGPIGVWLEAKIKDLAGGFEPAQIDRMRICLIPLAKNEPPEVAAYVELVEEQSESSMIKRFRGARANPGYEPAVYVSDENCFIRVSNQAFAVGPARFAQEMADAIDVNALTDRDFEMMLLNTDRDRHLTILFDPLALRTNQEGWFPENTLPLLNHFLDWVGDGIRCAVWSIHLNGEFHQEMILRNDQVKLTNTLQRNLTKRLEEVPGEVLAAVRKMNPQQVGARKIIGRFPAMTKVFTLATRSGSGDREVQFTTVLSDRAAPNLALGTLLTWDESTRTDFYGSKAPPTAVASSEEQKPKTLEEKLQQKIEIDFRRSLMNDAFAYISDDSGIPIELDGEALKLAGFTQNMPQVMKLGEVTVAEAIKAIFRGEGNAIIKDQLTKGTGEMVVCVDESKQGLIVTTKKYAEDNKIPVYQLK